jgi:mono/diheme cytochrome c family protein
MRRPPAPLVAAAAGAALLSAAAVVAVNDEGGGSARERAPAADPGLRVWASQGCGACHTLAAARSTSEVGPDLDQSLRGRSEDYVRESIVAPDAKILAGYSADMMPDDFARRISADELDALVRFVLDR